MSSVYSNIESSQKISICISQANLHNKHILPQDQKLTICALYYEYYINLTSYVTYDELYITNDSNNGTQ